MTTEKIISFAKSLAKIFGIGQMRCKNCLAPYFPDKSQSFSPTEQLCNNCLQKLMPLNGVRCKLCGVPLGKTALKKRLCSNCASEKPDWDHVACHGLYENDLRDLLLDYKFHASLYLASLFAELLFEASSCLPKPDMLIAVPMYHAHLNRRGFNQAHEISRLLAKKAGFKYSTKLLYRKKMVKAQEELTAAERKINLADSFYASDNVAKYPKIWLIDDIMTTGSTLRECARQLKKAGAIDVSVLFVGRTSPI